MLCDYKDGKTNAWTVLLVVPARMHGNSCSAAHRLFVAALPQESLLLTLIPAHHLLFVASLPGLCCSLLSLLTAYLWLHSHRTLVASLSQTQ